MKRKLLHVISLSIMTCFMLTACKNGPDPIRVIGITVSPTTLTLSEGETKPLTATVTPSNADDMGIHWTSSDTNIATVDASGNVTGIKVGKATVTVRTNDGEKTATCEVSVVDLTDYLSFKATVAATKVSFSKNGKKASELNAALEYSTDGKATWKSYTFGDEITLAKAGDVIYFRAGGTDGKNAVFSYGDNKYINFSSTEAVEAGGSVMSLLDRTCNQTSVPEYAFSGLFMKSNLTAAPKLPATELSRWCYYAMFFQSTIPSAPVLPATKLEELCYYGMFEGCPNLTAAPALPSTQLAMGCYAEMFTGCDKLTSAPQLPATELVQECYTYMFANCTALATAPSLPSTKLASRCYSEMFYGCSSLTSIPELPATNLETGCYSFMFDKCTSLTTTPALPATEMKNGCYMGMFEGCSSLTSTPALPATKLDTACYSSMFYECTGITSGPALPVMDLAPECYSYMYSGCSSLTTAPSLPATTLKDECYTCMFRDCVNLETAPELPASTLTTYCYRGMFEGCSKLSSVTCLASDLSADFCLLEWLKEAGTSASSRTLTVAPGMTYRFSAKVPSSPVWTIVETK